MKRLFLLLLLCSSLWATGPVTITGTIYAPSGIGTANGTVTIEWPSFTADDGHYVGASSKNYQVRNGVASPTFLLEPSTDSSPVFSYKVTYKLGASNPPVCYWVVPTTTASISAVQTCSPPAPTTVLFPPSQISSGGASSGQCLIFNGSNWAPASCFSGSGFANTALSNLASVSINTSLLAQTGVDLGSTVKPFRNLFLFGGGTYGTNYFRFTGTPTSTRTLTIPDITATLATRTGSFTTDNCLKIDANLNVVDAGAACGAGEVVGPAGATDNAIARFDTTTGKLIQNSLITIDDSGNASTPGTLSTGVGSGVAGATDWQQGTIPAVPSNSFGWGAGTTMTTSVRLQSPNAVPSANQVMLFGAPSSNIATWTWTGISGTGSFAMTTSPSFTTPALGTPSAVVLTNGTGLPIGGLTGLGTGVATALGLAVSGSGAICLASGSACSGGATNITIGSSTITSGTTTRVLYDNAGVLGEYTIEGNSTTVQMFTGSAPATNDCAKFDANHNLVTAGAACGSGSGGALVLVEQHTASTSASLNFTSCISSTYDEYMLELVNVLPATDAALLRMRMSTDGGSSYDSGSNYSWASIGYDTGASGRDGGAGVTFAQLGQLGPSNTASNGGMDGSFRFSNPGNSAARKHLYGKTAAFNAAAGGAWAASDFSGTYNSNTAVNAFQFLFSTGNIASGTIRCYGIAK